MTLAAIGRSIQDVSLFTAVRESVYVYPIVLSMHLACIATFGGLILLTNLRLLGWTLTDIPADTLIASLRPWKQLGFAIMVTCGVLLGGSKASEYLTNPFFQLKMALLAGLAAHGLYFGRRVYRVEARLISASQARAAAVLSLVLWISVVSMGRWIAYYDPPSLDDQHSARNGSQGATP
jgi:Family of unknown function (DUF6644)